MANLSSQPINVAFYVYGVNGMESSALLSGFPANSAQALFVDEFTTVPADHIGQIWIGRATGSIYVQGMLVSEER